LTVTVTVVLCESAPLTPVIVSVNFPVCALLETVTVRVELLPVEGLGLKLVDMPEPRPVTLNVTGPEKPPRRLMVREDCPCWPCVSVRVGGEAESEKS
jgi:hypothetical protein